MKKEAITHIPMSEYAHAVSESRAVFRLKAARGDLAACAFCYGDRADRQNPVRFTPVPMRVTHSDLLFDWWEVELEAPYRRLCYYFELTGTDSGGETCFYYANLFRSFLPAERSEFFQLPYIHREHIPRVPEWVKGAVVYNIFPDSFATGRRYVSLAPTEKKWNGELTRGKLGGTIRGITENVDYLTELGVNCVYINPFFTAGQYHKYDLLDYYSVDPCFGTNADFAELVDTLHRNGIKILIDGVFNHCGWRFFAFNDVVRNGAASRYADWFYRLEYPVVPPEDGGEIPGYECFAYERLMPKLNTANPEVVRYFCNVCRHWLEKYNVDGWRLDVADEVDDGFWRAFRNAARQANPDAFLIGEIWVSAGHWLDGSMFQSAMNYDFRKHCREFFAAGSINADEFDARVTDMLTRYRKDITCAQLNILDSHDVSRFLSLCGGDKRRLKLALAFQMCFIGLPSVFYGDEQGLTGLTEDEYRQPMTWDGDGELFEFYRQIISLRKNSKALTHGDYRTLTAEGTLYVFRRDFEGRGVTVIINAGEAPVLYEGREIGALSFMTSCEHTHA